MNRTLCLRLAAALLSLSTTTALAQSDPPQVTTIDRFSLILYAFDSDEPGPMNQRILDEYVVPEISPRSEITIVGYSDVVGQERHNFQLAERRARKVADRLVKKVGRDGYRSLEATAVGEEQAPYRHDLPEGRLLSRTVVITLKAQGEGRQWEEKEGATEKADE